MGESVTPAPAHPDFPRDRGRRARSRRGEGFPV